jgi:hypothetical protein
MNLKLKALGLALIAAFAMSAVVASSASATPVIGQYGAASGTVTGEGNNDVFTGGGTVTCNHVTYEGTFVDEDSTLRVTPSWTGCTAFGLANAHVTETGCDYLFHMTTNHTPNFTAQATLDCQAGGHVIITVTTFGNSVCTITFGDQDVPGDVNVTNAGGATPTMDINVHGTLSGIKYNVTTDHSFACPSVGSYTNGEYHANGATLRAYSDVAHTNQVDVTVETD